MKILVFIVAAFFLFLNTNLLAQENNSEIKDEIKREKFDPERDAAKDIENAIDEAQESNKRILLDVGGEWCIWCHRLDEFIETHEEIKNFMDNNFVVVKVNYSKENKNEEVLSKYPEIPGYPHYFILEENGEFLHSQGTADLEEGKGYSEEKMMEFLKKWASEK